MSEEELENLKEQAENGDESAIEELVDYYDSIGDTNEAELWKELLEYDDETDDEEESNNEDEFIYEGEIQNKMDDKTLLAERKKYECGEYEQYSFIKLDELVSINPYANFEYGNRYKKEGNLEESVSYYKKGVKLLEGYNSNDSDIQSDIEWQWAQIARTSDKLIDENESFAREAFDAYQNLLEVTNEDALKVEAYLCMSDYLENGIGVCADSDKAVEYTKKAHSLYVEGCLIEALQSGLKKENIQTQKWLEKAQIVNMLGYGKFENDEYFRDVLNIKLWVNDKCKIDGQKVEITPENILSICSTENQNSHHVITNFLLPVEIQTLKQKTNELISEILKAEYENIDSKETLYKLIISGNCDYRSGESVAYQMREFMKQYIIENHSESWVTTSHILELYRLLVEYNQGAEEWKENSENQDSKIAVTIDNELARIEQEREKQRQFEEAERERERQRQLEETEKERQRQIEEERRKKLELEIAKKECAEIEEKIANCNAKKTTSTKTDEEFLDELKKPLLIFLILFIITKIFKLGGFFEFIIILYIGWIIYKILYVDQPPIIADAIKKEFNVDIREWKAKKSETLPDFIIETSNDSDIAAKNKSFKVYFGKFNNCGLFLNESGDGVIKSNGTKAYYQNIKIKGYQTVFKGIIMLDALYINLDMNKVIDKDISLDSASLEIHNFVIEKE